MERRRPSDAELEREAEITELDIDAAIAQFDKDAAPTFRGLLDAASTDADG